MIPNKLQPFFDQIDTQKLQAAIDFVSSLGNGTKAFYVQEFSQPYTMDVYISVELRRNVFEIRAHKYGGQYDSLISQALNLASEPIFDEMAE